MQTNTTPLVKVKLPWFKPQLEIVDIRSAQATHLGIPPDGLLTKKNAS